MTMEMNFTDKASYLAWRRNWKAAYAEQSEEIRAAKREIVKLAKADKPTGYAQSTLHRERELASRMMVALEEAKKLSAEMRAARLAQPQQAAA